ncbi:MAG: lysylphosphatidylglycerol synthase transmembrane domain-containing protein [Bryobacteraceae bacterium]
MSSPFGNGGRRFPAWLGPALAYAVSLGCLLWVYHDFDWRTELPKLRHIHPLWIALAVAADVLVYVSQGWRWNILLAPVQRLGLWRSVQAIYIGLFANELLPLRSGELIRCYLVSTWNRIPFPLVLSSALIERLIDGMWLIFGFAIISVFVELPQDVVAGVWILAGVIGAIGALVVFAVFNERFAHHVTTRHRWSDVLRTAVEGLHDMGRSGSFLLAVAASIVYLALQVAPIHAMLEGYGLDLPWGAAAVVLVVLRLGTVLPSAPGNVGLFHLFAYLGLHRVLGVDAQTAKSVAGVMFFIVTVPLLVAGAIALAFTGSEIRELYHRAHQRHSEHRNSVSQFRGTLR